MATPKKPVKKSPRKKPTDDLISERPYIIDTIFPAYEVHLLGGPSGAGKSRWMFQTLERWQQGESIFGFKSHPVPWVYVTADRSYASVCDTLRDLGIDPQSVNVLPARDIEPEATGYSLPWLFKQIETYYPECKLVVIEAIGTFVPGGKQNDYAIVAKFLRDLGRWCMKKHKTIIGTHHTTKEKLNMSYISDREKLMGSGGWSGFAETLAMVLPVNSNKANSPMRKISIMPRNASALVLNFKFDNTGRLIQMSDAEAALAGISGKSRRSQVQKQLREYFTTLKTPSFSMKDVITCCQDVSRATVVRQIEEWCEEGVLKKTAHGVYTLVGRETTKVFEGNLL